MADEVEARKNWDVTDILHKLIYVHCSVITEALLPVSALKMYVRLFLKFKFSSPIFYSKRVLLIEVDIYYYIP